MFLRGLRMAPQGDCGLPWWVTHPTSPSWATKELGTQSTGTGRSHIRPPFLPEVADLGEDSALPPMETLVGGGFHAGRK